MVEDDLFGEAMGQVTRLGESDKAHIESVKRRRIVVKAVRNIGFQPLLVGESVHFQAGDDPWQLVADGVSRDHIKRLSAGSPPISQNLDLHGMTRDAALIALQETLAHALLENDRVICVVHGRGLHSQGEPILKQAVYHWLRHGPLASMILAAIAQSGRGGGACLILLRRQEKK